MGQTLHLSFTAGSARPRVCPRETHCRHCPVPWGYDPLHSDQLTPYTVDQLDARGDEHPHRYAYPDKDTYLAGFNLWRALRRDGCLTTAEGDAKLIALAECWGVPHWRPSTR